MQTQQRSTLPNPFPLSFSSTHSCRLGTAAALLELVATAAIALGTTRHGRHSKASNGLVGRLVGHLQHEILGFALEREIADPVAAAGDGHDDDEGVVLLVEVLKTTRVRFHPCVRGGLV